MQQPPHQSKGLQQVILALVFCCRCRRYYKAGGGRPAVGGFKKTGDTISGNFTVSVEKFRLLPVFPRVGERIIQFPQDSDHRTRV